MTDNTACRIVYLMNETTTFQVTENGYALPNGEIIKAPAHMTALVEKFQLKSGMLVDAVRVASPNGAEEEVAAWKEAQRLNPDAPRR